MIFNMNIPITTDSRRKCHKIANHTIMRDVAIYIGMKIAANFNIGRQGDKWAQQTPDTQIDLI